MKRLHDRFASRHGQTLVETALVLPLFITVVTGIIVLGIGLFYQQQVDNAARESARYAAIHSATSRCPTSSWRDVKLAMMPFEHPFPQNCDQRPVWPQMTAHARNLLFGLERSQLYVSACWSGYWDRQIVEQDPGNQTAYDAGPTSIDATTGDVEANIWRECTIGGIPPLTRTSDLPCPPPTTSATDDQASSFALSTAATANRVTAYACYVWSPPLAGFLLVPESVTLRSVVSEALQHQR